MQRLLFIFLAMSFGLLGYYLVSPGEKSNVKVERVEPKQFFVAAARDLTAGTILNKGDVRWVVADGIDLPGESILQLGDVAPPSVIGSALRVAVMNGKPILTSTVLAPDSPGFFGATLRPGWRAIAVNVDKSGLSTFGGLVSPNDRVDVIRILDEGENTGTARTLLTDVRVLAVGGRIDAPSAVMSEVTSASSTVRKANADETVTLEVTPAQAEVLALQGISGKVILTLRALGDDVQFATPPLRVINFRGGTQIEARPLGVK